MQVFREQSRPLRNSFLDAGNPYLSVTGDPSNVPGDDVAAAQPSILHHLISQELSQALGRADGYATSAPHNLPASRHGTVLRDQLEQFRIQAC